MNESKDWPEGSMANTLDGMMLYLNGEWTTVDKAVHTTDYLRGYEDGWAACAESCALAQEARDE